MHDEKPWLKHYDAGVAPDVPAADTTYAHMLEESFSDFADRAALHFMGVTQKFRELDLLSRRFAAFLGEIGCGPGDVVGINLPNTPQYLIAHAGALRAGCAATGVSPLLTPKEMAYQLNDCGARVLVTLDAIFEQRVTKIHEKVAKLSHIVPTGIADFLPWPKRTLGRLLKKIPTGKISPLPGKTVIHFRRLLESYPPKAPKIDIKPENICLIQYTGGTTGMPKGAELTHGNMVSNLLQSKQWLDTKRGGEIYISGFPFFHLAGLMYGMSGMGLGNTQILIPDPRNTKHICDEFARYLPTAMANVPSLYQMLLAEPMFKTLNFTQVKACLSGAAPFPVDSFSALEALVGEGKVIEVYGMTEASPLLTMNPFRGLKKIGTVGIPIQSTHMKLMDLETGEREVAVGEEGEIIARGPQIMKGYWKKPEETAHAMRSIRGETWLYTGDVAKMDADGYFTIVDRAKDMLNVGGFKVFSKEVEETLYEHPAIQFCAVIGLPNPERPGSEVVKAVVQLSANFKDKDRDAIERELMQYCHENMAPYKRPKSIEFVESLPLTAVGKVDKKALRPNK
ncbi:MAG: AMP-dependent synthetase [Candidatus Abyssobacteria bacterium SURF_5]|uniref:AMP-dependent synthetase n=1 Tax=Abyssobacteria bacterium (strain SURF_5) TaxID=2093360 RepID=A0A3A4NUY1_ABYX5|nr:MAG: AMP-dependent synthetase [Candidatus Abyssubacteria bacterium SURF_5]